MDNCFYRVSIKAIIEDNDGRALFVQEKDGRWHLPGGGLENGETIAECLKRELLEEHGTRLISMGNDPFFIWSEDLKRNHGIDPCLFIAYKAKIGSIDQDQAMENYSYSFFDLKNISELNLHPAFDKLKAFLLSK
jgi:8-oxo-dGTP pyrophosphatase MutT (NUDIX family)